jgi:hypothetical protein
VNKHLADSPSRWQDFFVHAFALDASQRLTPARIYLSELERALS